MRSVRGANRHPRPLRDAHRDRNHEMPRLPGRRPPRSLQPATPPWGATPARFGPFQRWSSHPPNERSHARSQISPIGSKPRPRRGPLQLRIGGLRESQRRHAGRTSGSVAAAPIAPRSRPATSRPLHRRAGRCGRARTPAGPLPARRAPESRASLPSPPTLHFFRNVGPRMSGPFPRDRFFILSRFLTVPGPGEGPRRPKTPKDRPLQFSERKTCH